jgi:hypothetical protein
MAMQWADLMVLDKTKLLFSKAAQEHALSAEALMKLVLESSLELVNLTDNNFICARWDGAIDASKEINDLMKLLSVSNSLAKNKLSLLFAPTASFQELSILSGWGEIFIKLSQYHDFSSEQLTIT